MIVSGVRKVPDSEFLGFRSCVITGLLEFTEYMPGNFVKKIYFFCFSINSVSLEVFDDADSKFSA